MGESNSRPEFGKLLLCHLTNPARRKLLYHKAVISEISTRSPLLTDAQLRQSHLPVPIYFSFQIRTSDALMNYGKIPFRFDYRNRFHHSAAFFSAITGIFVHVFRPKTVRTMICVTIPDDFPSAMPADEILDCFLKLFRVLYHFSGRRESNPGRMIPNHEYYRYTTPRETHTNSFSQKT